MVRASSCVPATTMPTPLPDQFVELLIPYLFQVTKGLWRATITPKEFL
jgi:hypothetical protein